jgi:uncharacterized RDD family membrane protein YckC
VLNHHKIDNSISVEVPEGIDLTAELAGPTVRALAYSIDITIRFAVSLVIYLLLIWFGNVGHGAFLICIFAMEWFYPVFFEVLADGQTPGKKKFNIQVVNTSLTPVHWEASIIRNLLRAVDFLPFANVIGLISMLMNKEFKRLGDYAAGTVVIYKRQLNQYSLPEAKLQYLSEPLSLAEQLAIINFTYRHKQLSKARQAELAKIIDNLHKHNDESSIEYIHGVGLALIGKR